jgi:phosphoheptose isomerase
MIDTSARSSDLPDLSGLRAVFDEHLQVAAEAAEQLLPTLARIIEIAICCLGRGNKILACGNGGSAADAQHFVAELVGSYRRPRPALAALTLMGDPATFTSLANDFGYDRVFSRQIEGLANRGDLLLAITTSGNSANIVLAAMAAQSQGCAVVALTGRGGGRIIQHADVVLRVPSDTVARVQEVHGLCLHALAHALDATPRAGGGA